MYFDIAGEKNKQKKKTFFFYFTIETKEEEGL